MTIIAIDSDPGSDGDLIAASVAARLGLTLVDEKSLLDTLCCEDQRIAKTILGEECSHLPDKDGFPWRNLGTKLHIELLRLAQQEQILLHWPCATYLLAEVGHVLRIKVRAPLNMRVRRYASRCGCNEQEARRRIQQYEGKTRFVFGVCFGIKPSMRPAIYSLVADTGWLAASDWSDEIVELASEEEFAPTTESNAMLRWQILQLPGEVDGRPRRSCDASP
jgi:Cytidylate kinase-like family